MADRMEIHLERVIEEPYAALETALRAGPARWLPGFDDEGERVTGELIYEQAGGRVKRRIEVRPGPVQRFAYGVTVRIEWKAAQHSEFYPELEGHLRLERRQPSGSILRLEARYAPPGGWLGTTVDRALMHRVAESSVRDFLARVADLLVAGEKPP
jgi:hypothetical protein